MARLSSKAYVYATNKQAGYIAGVSGTSGTNGRYLNTVNNPGINVILMIADYFGIGLELAYQRFRERQKYQKQSKIFKEARLEAKFQKQLDLKTKKSEKVKVSKYSVINAGLALKELIK